jgi:hypothetical protein
MLSYCSKEAFVNDALSDNPARPDASLLVSDMNDGRAKKSIPFTVGPGDQVIKA